MYQAKTFGTHSIRWSRDAADQLPALLDDWDTWMGFASFADTFLRDYDLASIGSIKRSTLISLLICSSELPCNYLSLPQPALL